MDCDSGGDDRSGDVNVAELKAGLTALPDIIGALNSGLSNLPQDELIFGDLLEIAALVDPAIVPFEILLPVAEFLVSWLIANNKIHQQAPLEGGKRGSDPWQNS